MKVTKTTRLLGRPPIITNAHGPNCAAGKIKPGDELYLEGKNLRPVIEELGAVIVRYPTSDGEMTVPVMGESVGMVTPTHMSGGLCLLDTATVGGTVDVEVHFADGKVATATSEIIGN